MPPQQRGFDVGLRHQRAGQRALHDVHHRPRTHAAHRHRVLCCGEQAAQPVRDDELRSILQALFFDGLPRAVQRIIADVAEHRAPARPALQQMRTEKAVVAAHVVKHRALARQLRRGRKSFVQLDHGVFPPFFLISVIQN